ncbi:MAG: class I SAM-dependent methyltransferase [Lewinellaceae bacterium]|nr:class I SAM-dependent methyltransferase [Phaeodactylibacter sp.]MCB9036173.1 class I SAM-dependent methyltransferase [Lewinellaceae bacterium]
MDVNVTFGKMQAQMSQRMQRFPRLSRWAARIFGYTLVGNYARALSFKSLLGQLPLESFRKILDLGCGYGEYSFLLSEALPRATITALDLNKAAIANIRRLAAELGMGNLETHLGPIESVEGKDGWYDLIFSIDVFEHIREEEMPFAEAFRKLRPGGYLLVKMPSREQLTLLPESWFEDHHHWLEEEHIGQVYSLEGLKARMEKEGFKVLYAAYGDGWWSRLGWEVGYLSRKAGPLAQLLCLPLAKLLVRVDRWGGKKESGNTIQVIGQKP